jgi:uncharacterized protein (DUF305 family)
MNIRPIALATSALALALLAGCSTTATGMHHAGSSASAGASASESFNDSDVAFVMTMIPHHQQAVEMADIVIAKPGVDARVVTLADEIKAAQAPEITQMTGWLRSWDQPMPSAMSGMDMGGMMSQSDMDALTNAPGAEASKLFLLQMTEHHQGAIDMSNEELSSGKSTKVLSLAKSIVASQTAEIATMKKLLATL